MTRSDPSCPTKDLEISGVVLGEGWEYLGEFDSPESYLRCWLARSIDPGIAWVLEHVDYQALLAELAAAGTRYVCAAGRVYRRCSFLKI